MLTRNCSRFAPEKMSAKKKPWRPQYVDVRSDGKSIIYNVDGVESFDCPVACVTPESRGLVNLYMRAELMKVSAGELTYGNNPSKWPSKFVDAMEILKINDLNERSERNRATS